MKLTAYLEYILKHFSLLSARKSTPKFPKIGFCKRLVWGGSLNKNDCYIYIKGIFELDQRVSSNSMALHKLVNAKIKNLRIFKNIKWRTLRS